MNQLAEMEYRWRRRFERRVLILMYHRVAESDCDPWSLCVSPHHFDAQLQVIRRVAPVIQSQDLAKHLADGEMPRRSIVITFDDGYADNFYNAKPLLERYGLQATFFIVSSFVGSEREFWWDELDRLFLQPGKLPPNLVINIEGKDTVSFGLSNDYSVESYKANRNWKAWEDPPTGRHSLYYSLWQQLRPLPDFDRQRILEELRTWAKSDPRTRASNRTLTETELTELSLEPLMEVGCHTVSHPQLSSLSPSNQREEIIQSKMRLEELIGRPIKSFAFPYGGETDYTSETLAIVQDAGFTSACSTVTGIVTKNSDRFQLPRMAVEDWDGDEFEKRLHEWFQLQLD